MDALQRLNTLPHSPEIPRNPQPGCAFVKKLRLATETELVAQSQRWPDVQVGNTKPAKFSGDRMPSGQKFCTNCGLGSHFFAECMAPLSEGSLTLSGCPIHGTREHHFDQCFHSLAFTQASLEVWLVKHRIGKPMIDSTLYYKLNINWNLPPTERPLRHDEVKNLLPELSNWQDYVYPDKKAVAQGRQLSLALGSQNRPTFTPKLANNPFSRFVDDSSHSTQSKFTSQAQHPNNQPANTNPSGYFGGGFNRSAQSALISQVHSPNINPSGGGRSIGGESTSMSAFANNIQQQTRSLHRPEWSSNNRPWHPIVDDAIKHQPTTSQSRSPAYMSNSPAQQSQKRKRSDSVLHGDENKKKSNDSDSENYTRVKSEFTYESVMHSSDFSQQRRNPAAPMDIQSAILKSKEEEEEANKEKASIPHNIFRRLFKDLVDAEFSRSLDAQNTSFPERRRAIEMTVRPVMDQHLREVVPRDATRTLQIPSKYIDHIVGEKLQSQFSLEAEFDCKLVFTKDKDSPEHQILHYYGQTGQNWTNLLVRLLSIQQKVDQTRQCS